MYWLSQSKFPDSYLQISMQPSEDSVKTDRTEQEVWAKLLSIGIDEEMIKASAGKGAKDSIIGTYRIILYQCQAPEHDKERNKVSVGIFDFWLFWDLDMLNLGIFLILNYRKFNELTFKYRLREFIIRAVFPVRNSAKFLFFSALFTALFTSFLFKFCK